MLASSYPLLDVFWSILEFFLFVAYIWLLIAIFADIFRSQDLGGGAKCLWVVLVFIIPFLGILIYLIVRGGSMHERAAAQAQRQQDAFDAQVRQAAGSDSADQLAKLAALKDQGVITDAEFQAQKAKILA